MIDPENLDAVAKEGFKLLYESGCFHKQAESEYRRLTSGDTNEDPSTLTKRIIEYRRRAGMFEGLHALGGELKSKENEQ